MFLKMLLEKVLLKTVEAHLSKFLSDNFVQVSFCASFFNTSKNILKFCVFSEPLQTLYKINHLGIIAFKVWTGSKKRLL